MSENVPAPESSPALPGDSHTEVVDPIHKRAFGMATGIVAGIVVFIATVFAVLRGGAPNELALLANYFPGYSVSWAGAVLGGACGAFSFFVAGWCCALLRNFVVAASVWIVRAKAELKAGRDFLDHI